MIRNMKTLISWEGTWFFYEIKIFLTCDPFGKLSYRIVTFFESLKVALINMVAILVISVKLATLGPLEIKAFQNKVMMS